jgi:hypothetical protein
VEVENADCNALKQQDKEGAFLSQTVRDLHSAYVALLPNKAPLLRVDVPRGAFATYENKIVFADGMLTAATYDHKSIVYGLFGALGDLANSIVAIPAQILSVKIDQTNQREKLVEAQTKLIETQQKYLGALKALEETKKPPTGGSSVPGADASRALGECAPEDRECRENLLKPY